MKPSPTLDLLCPTCGMAVLQVHPKTRPIQENKITCPACKEQTKIAAMQTAYGDSFQAHLRDVDQRGKIALYEPHLTPYGKARPSKNYPGAKRKAERSRNSDS